MMLFKMASRNKNPILGFKRIGLAVTLIALGCVAPLLIIHFQKSYPHWQPLGLEALGLGGLGLIFSELLLNK
jgi:hypothetical protein